uniref:Uncharacterized protein n=1 Tax=Panagrolaimus davidi TaxID=227884 RepID=A0A914PG37_9BILA
MMTILFNLVALKDYISLYSYRKYLKSTPTLKRAIFYSKICHQDFSLPNSIVYYMAQNPALPKVYEKIIQCCKYFFIKNPILVTLRLRFYGGKWCINCKSVKTDIFECKFERKPYDITKVTSKFWITDLLFIEPEFLEDNEIMDKNIVSSNISKFYKCAPKYLKLCYQNIFFHDLSLLLQSAEKIYFIDVCVKNDDGSNVAVEKIVEIAVEAKMITFHHSTITNKNTMKELLKIPNFLKLDVFSLTNLSEDFDIETFYNYMKKNKTTKFWFHFQNQISEAYKNRIETIVDEIIATKEFIYKPPMIYFPEIDDEKFETLKNIYFLPLNF